MPSMCARGVYLFARTSRTFNDVKASHIVVNICCEIYTIYASHARAGKPRSLCVSLAIIQSLGRLCKLEKYFSRKLTSTHFLQDFVIEF